MSLAKPVGVPMLRQNLLRAESFGGFFYNQQSGLTSVLPQKLFDLLVLAREASILELYANNTAIFSGGDHAFAELVADWQDKGFLDAQFRCAARLVRNRPVAQGLTAPTTLHFDLTTACNLHCTHCYVSERRVHPALSTERIVAVITELEKMGVPVAVLTGGEPLLRPDIFEIVDAFSRHQVDAYFCTNATLIDKDIAQRLAASALRGFQVSFDGPDRVSHDVIRGAGAFDKAVAGVHELVAAGANSIQVRVTATKPILHRLLEFAELARQLEIDRVVIKPINMVGQALMTPELAVGRQAYLDAIQDVDEKWPREVCEIQLGDWQPGRMPAWTGIMSDFSCPGGNTTARIAADARVLACSVLAADDWTLKSHNFEQCWRESPSIMRWRNLEPSSTCAACSALQSCAGACRIRAIGAGGSLADPDPQAVCLGRGYE